MGKSSVASNCPCLTCHSQNSGVPRDQLLYHALSTTKVVRPRSDQASRCTDEDRSEKTDD